MRWALFALPVICFCQDGQRESRPGWPCVAGRAVDPSYIQISESTGGQLFLLQKNEVQHSSIIMMAPQTHPTTLYRAVGQLAGVREFEVPIDSTVKTLLLMASLQ